MANEEQLSILKQGVDVWNKWRDENPNIEIDLSQADLVEYYLREAKFEGANLKKAKLSFSDLTEALFERPDSKRADLRDASLYHSDLTGANLRRADLQRVDLRQAILNEAKLSGANLTRANLNRAILVGADLSGAGLKLADLREANLKNANLKVANLRQADLRGAILAGANLSRASLGQTTIGFTNLGRVVGLDTIRHYEPSVLGHETISNSRGKIPAIFLRGCGFSDIDIEFAKLANPGLDPEQVADISSKIHQLYVGGDIQFHSCFISYNSKDKEFAEKLHDDLQNNGVRCWFAPEDMKIGDQIRPTIDRQIRLREKLLVIISENSVKSEWVGDEVEAALEEEAKSNRLVLFPIRLDDAIMNTRDDWAAKIKRRRHIGDFSNWIDQSNYKKALERLLRDLKATNDSPPEEEK